ncbi:hypothetical protein Anas_14126, partial [Armadillidium nasatum]
THKFSVIIAKFLEIPNVSYSELNIYYFCTIYQVIYVAWLLVKQDDDKTPFIIPGIFNLVLVLISYYSLFEGGERLFTENGIYLQYFNLIIVLIFHSFICSVNLYLNFANYP